MLRAPVAISLFLAQPPLSEKAGPAQRHVVEGERKVKGVLSWKLPITPAPPRS